MLTLVEWRKGRDLWLVLDENGRAASGPLPLWMALRMLTFWTEVARRAG
jgi:hypothetical protein